MQRRVEQFSRNLNNNGFIITDNMDFHGYVKKDEKEIKSRNLRQLVRKIKEYRVYLEENSDYHTDFYTIGDGISVSRKKDKLDI